MRVYLLSFNIAQNCISFSPLYFYLQLIFQMPLSHRNVFTYISAFLRELLLHSNDNKLDAKTLGQFNHLCFLFCNSDSYLLGCTWIKVNCVTHFLARTRARLYSHPHTHSFPRVHRFSLYPSPLR